MYIILRYVRNIHTYVYSIRHVHNSTCLSKHKQLCLQVNMLIQLLMYDVFYICECTVPTDTCTYVDT